MAWIKSLRRRVTNLATKLQKMEKENKSKEANKIAKEIRNIISQIKGLEK